MTQAQDQAIAEVRKIMKQHFDSWLITYRITDENLNSKIHHDWHGDVVDIVGLSSITQQRLLQYTSLRGGDR